MFSVLIVVVAFAASDFAASDFGATGDGVAKDAAAIQRAVDAAATAEDFKRISNRFWFREVER